MQYSYMIFVYKYAVQRKFLHTDIIFCHNLTT